MRQRNFPHPSTPALRPTNHLCYGYRVSFWWVRRPWRGVYRPTLSSAQDKERVELYLYSVFGPSWLVLGWILFRKSCHLWDNVEKSVTVW